MAFWSCEPELSICSFLIYATQTLTPSDKGQALLLVWCLKMTAQGKVCPWRNSRNLCSEPMGNASVGFCPKTILRGVQVYKQKYKGQSSLCWWKKKKIPSYLGDNFRRMLNFFFFFPLTVKNRRAAGLHHILSCWIIRERKHTFIHRRIMALAAMHN